MTPALSVVIPNRDSPWIGATLEALGRQVAPQPWEVLVVGCDGPGQVPRAGLLPRQDAGPPPPLRFLESSEPLSPAAARNRGVAEARGAKILFTDADCVPQPGWLQHLAGALDTSPVAGGAVTFDLDAGYWAVADNIASFHELLTDRPAEANSDRPLGSLNLAVTRDAWQATGPFDEDLITSEDMDWVLRSRAAGLATAFVPGAVVEHAAVREDRAALEAHARWYGEHFHAFRRRHPGELDRGPTWRSRRRLALAAPIKAWVSALTIFLRHRQLPLRFLPGVARFKRAWYDTIVEGWESGSADLSKDDSG